MLGECIVEDLLKLWKQSRVRESDPTDILLQLSERAMMVLISCSLALLRALLHGVSMSERRKRKL